MGPGDVVDDHVDERVAGGAEALGAGGATEDRGDGVEAALAERASERVLFGGGAVLVAAGLDVGLVLGFGEALMDRDQFGGGEPVSAVGGDLERVTEVGDVGVAVLDGVVACIVGAVLVGVLDEPVDAQREVAVRELLGIVEQDRGELWQPVADPTVAVDVDEPGDLRLADPPRQPCLAEPVDLVDGSRLRPQTARFAARAVERCPQVGVDRAMPVDFAEATVLGDLDGGCELAIELAAFQSDLSDPVVECLIGEPHQAFQELAEHGFIVLEHTFDYKSVTWCDTADRAFAQRCFQRARNAA